MKSGRPVTKSPTDALKLLDNRPNGLIFKFETPDGAKEALEASADKATKKIEREEKSAAKYKADAPKRKAEASKFASEQRKKTMAEYEKLYGKGTWNRVTYKQEGGDDGYQYVVRVDGRAIMNGLTQREAMYQKTKMVDGIAKKEKLGKYAE